MPVCWQLLQLTQDGAGAAPTLLLPMDKKMEEQSLLASPFLFYQMEPHAMCFIL